MSELARRGERDPDDYYATTPPMALLACQTLRSDFIANPGVILEPSSILEPGCGSGSWLPGIRATWPSARILGVERNPELADYSRRRGFTVEQRDLLRGELGTYDLIVGNPPFKYADELIPMLLTRLRPGGVLAFLLRLNFFEGQDRYERFWRIYPATAAYPLPARPGFTADGGTDGTGYMICCWQQGKAGPTRLRHLDNRFVQVKWNGTPALKEKGVVVRAAVLDPAFPDPRTRPEVSPPVVAPVARRWF
ncbi:MAG: hypothetical protein QOI63_988 [Thermoplasmata archaeon]|jgi:SAM-dependent methyltransferase|nr:hypothetical protein [Thermoplasmata archaeon]